MNDNLCKAKTKNDLLSFFFRLWKGTTEKSKKTVNESIMTDLIKSYEQQFGNLTAEATAKISELSRVAREGAENDEIDQVKRQVQVQLIFFSTFLLSLKRTPWVRHEKYLSSMNLK